MALKSAVRTHSGAAVRSVGNESYSDDCRSDGSIYWAGSPSVANRNATIVRRWIVRLGKQNSSGKMRVFPSFRACGYKRDVPAAARGASLAETSLAASSLQDRFCYNRACKGGACSESVSLKSMADCSRAVAANPRCGHSFSFGKDGWCDCVPPGKPCLPKRGAGYVAVDRPAIPAARAGRRLNKASLPPDPTGQRSAPPSLRCVNGLGVGGGDEADQKFGQHAKGVMRREMAAAQFCLVPEGDSPDSSRVIRRAAHAFPTAATPRARHPCLGVRRCDAALHPGPAE